MKHFKQSLELIYCLSLFYCHGADPFTAIHWRAAAKGNHADDRDQDDGQEHHAALDEVGPADGHEAAQEGVNDDDAGAEDQGREVIHAEDRFKELAAGDEA